VSGKVDVRSRWYAGHLRKDEEVGEFLVLPLSRQILREEIVGPRSYGGETILGGRA